MATSFGSDSSVEVFRSRVDAWLVALVFLITMGTLIVAMVAPSTNAGLGKGAGIGIAAVTAVLIGLLFYWSYRTTTYTLSNDTLDVRCAGLHWHIRTRDITRVEYSTNPLSAPALSLRRLKVCYGKYGWLLISPVDREGFIAALQRRVGTLEVRR